MPNGMKYRIRHHGFVEIEIDARAVFQAGAGKQVFPLLNIELQKIDCLYADSKVLSLEQNETDCNSLLEYLLEQQNQNENLVDYNHMNQIQFQTDDLMY